MFDLLTASLRHRPNYIVIGEVRGREAFTMGEPQLAGVFNCYYFQVLWYEQQNGI